ncbi:peptidase M13 [Geothrix rubra]|uniref:Peptidase M13 n=1 Tax=Geothrix rubra TaxID=2927977 RepID=A0ABQ5Q6I5_9BACT|nr:M13 family metallopeptidase [Geothrix rubra]GLH70360.1 peptidase M13 [Geothrix rubra]
MSPRHPWNASLLALALVAGPLAAGAPAAAPAKAATPGLDLAGMDRTVKPGDDFFAYTNGTWFKHTVIPPDRSADGPFAHLFDLTNRRTGGIILAAAKAKAPEGTELRKIGDYYRAFLDTAAIEQAGLKPIQPLLAQVQALGDRKALSAFLGGTLRADVDAINATNLYTDNLFGLWVAQDLNDPSHYSAFLLQGGLGMPDRDYYLDPSPRMQAVRDQYRAHIARVLALAGEKDAEAKAARVLDLEHRIAEAHATREDSEEVKKGDNPWSRADFTTKAPGMDWEAFFAAAGLGAQQTFVAWQPGAVTGLSALVAGQPLETWKDYLAFHALDHHAAVLPKAFGDEAFAFYGKVIQGTPQQRDRQKRAVDATNAALGDAVGRRYAEKYFPAADKARAQAMVQNILAAFRARIDQLDWMAPETKAKAKAKLAVLKVGVGYPDRWEDYGALEIKAGDAFGNEDRAERFQLHQAVAKLGRPVDRGEWVMTPQTVNAVNLPVMNALNFPAAILQPPFYDPKRPEAMNYGSIGAVIGHEISHSFDNQGALFDDQGRLKNWWTEKDFAHFEASADQLARQFDAYRPFPDAHVNGKLTLGENIADVAGLAAALDAYHLSLKGKAAPTVGGFTGDQQFFIAFGQSWRTKMREAALRQRLLADGHAPAEYRADTVRNLDAWYAAFAVKPGEKLYLAPKDRVKIW